jgi:C4-dicarboxylate-specific signal transduction histidine kinase
VDRVSEALAEAVNQTRRAAGILERLRAFVGRQGVQLEPVAVNQVVINALTLLSNKLSESGVRVSLHTQPCPPVRADALQLEQVMVNLVRNAIEAMQDTEREQRRLHIDTHTIAGRVHVAVTDSGHGLSQQADQQIFTRFFTTKPDGMGLGLSISRTILEAAAGELSASNVLGNGACFRFSLPVCITEEMRHGHSLA